MLCNGILYYAMLWHVILCYVMACYFKLCHRNVWRHSFSLIPRIRQSMQQYSILYFTSNRSEFFLCVLEVGLVPRLHAQGHYKGTTEKRRKENRTEEKGIEQKGEEVSSEEIS